MVCVLWIVGIGLCQFINNNLCLLIYLDAFNFIGS